MPEDVADGFERCTVVQQIRGIGVPQTMRTLKRNV